MAIPIVLKQVSSLALYCFPGLFIQLYFLTKHFFKETSSTSIHL